MPVLMLPPRTASTTRPTASTCGADDYLIKPFSYVVLVARLRALPRRGRPARSEPAGASGDLVLDPASRRVAGAATEIALTAREFALLEYLMRRPGQVVTKTELLDHVWERPARRANVVEVYVGYLRRKIDQPFGAVAADRAWGGLPARRVTAPLDSDEMATR